MHACESISYLVLIVLCHGIQLDQNKTPSFIIHFYQTLYMKRKLLFICARVLFLLESRCVGIPSLFESCVALLDHNQG